MWGLSSSGRAPVLHSGGGRFESDRFHQVFGSVAQMVERCPEKAGVVVSKATRATKLYGSSLAATRHFAWDEDEVGSTPTARTKLQR